MTEDETIKALQAGTIGTVVSLYLMCHDLQNRDTGSRQKALTSAYHEMMNISPGLRTKQATVMVSSGENNHFISMEVRFMQPSDAPAFQAECYRILNRYEFE